VKKGVKHLSEDLPSKAELKELGRDHWKKFRPKHYRAFKESGYLDEALENAAKFPLEAYVTEKRRLLEKGFTDNQAHQVAWELVREEWLLLPDEEWENGIRLSKSRATIKTALDRQ
jgi:cation transport regulator ChaB